MTAFPSTSRLERLRVSFVPTADLCWEMDATKVSGKTTKTAPLNKVAKPPDILERALEGLPHELVESLQAPDSTIPASKEIKKFARKLPRLERLEWVGREGKGSWNVVKPSAEKKGGLLTVDFEHAGLRYSGQWEELYNGPIVISQVDDQDVPVSDVPPPATPSTSVFSPGSTDLQMLSPMTNGSTLASDDIDTPLTRWQSSRSQSFPCLGGPWPDETQENAAWDTLGLQNISPSPSSNVLAKARQPPPSKGKLSPSQGRSKSSPNTTKSSPTPLRKKPSLPRAETALVTATETPPRRRGRRGGVGRSRGGTSTAAVEATPKPSPVPAISPSPDGWMTVSTKKPKDPVKPARTGGSSGKTKK